MEDPEEDKRLKLLEKQHVEQEAKERAERLSCIQTIEQHLNAYLVAHCRGIKASIQKTFESSKTKAEREAISDLHLKKLPGMSEVENDDEKQFEYIKAISIFFVEFAEKYPDSKVTEALRSILVKHFKTDIVRDYRENTRAELSTEAQWKAIVNYAAKKTGGLEKAAEISILREHFAKSLSQSLGKKENTHQQPEDVTVENASSKSSISMSFRKGSRE